jgi:hypothetical protein
VDLAGSPGSADSGSLEYPADAQAERKTNGNNAVIERFIGISHLWMFNIRNAPSRAETIMANTIIDGVIMMNMGLRSVSFVGQD